MSSTNKVIGIDLGTSCSCVGVWVDNRVEIIPNDQGNRTTPSFISFDDDKRLIGEAAKSRAAMNWPNTLFDIKHLIGRKTDDPDIQHIIRRVPYKVVKKDKRLQVRVQYRKKLIDLCPEEVTAMMLVRLKEMAESYLKGTVTDAVISVPAHFNNYQRQATKDAATIAGLNVLRLINEPTAAVIAHGAMELVDRERNILIFDLGGGSLDVSIITVEMDVFHVQASAGHNQLGGEDFDDRIVQHLVQEFKRKHKKDISTNPRALRRLQNASERAKRELSSATQSYIEIDSLLDGIDFYTSLTRTKFEELCIDLFRTILQPIEKVLRDSKIDKSKVEEIVMVGGSSRIPYIVNLVSNFFNGLEPKKKINPDEAVAQGAAIVGALLSNAVPPKIQGIIPIEVLTFRIGTASSDTLVVENVIRRNAIIPTRTSAKFPTSADNQIGILVNVYEGERVRGKDNKWVSRIELTGLTPKPKGTHTLELAFDVDANGILSISVPGADGAKMRNLVVTNDYLSSQDISRMIHDANQYRTQDQAITRKGEAKHALETYLSDVSESIELVFSSVGAVRSWLEMSQHASADEYDERGQELQTVVLPMIERLYLVASGKPSSLARDRSSRLPKTNEFDVSEDRWDGADADADRAEW